MWTRDPTVWHHDSAHHQIIQNSLGWLRITKQQLPCIPRLLALAEEIKEAGVKHVLVLGLGDYFAINAYVERTDAVHWIFERMRIRVCEAKQVATTLGYGLRFLHPTGQMHKGGPNSGVFIQVACDDQGIFPCPVSRIRLKF
jgi:hypothetical protein